MKQRSAVYKLLDQNGKVVYVGQTQDPELRLWQHTAPSSKSFPKQKLEIEVLQWFDTRKEARKFELLKQEEYGLLPETKIISMANTGLKYPNRKKKGTLTEEHKQKIKEGLAKIGNFNSYKRGVPSKLKGRKMTDEQRALISIRTKEAMAKLKALRLQQSE